MTALVLGAQPWPWTGRPALMWDYNVAAVRCQLTFPVRMDQTATPANADFTIRADGVNKTPTSVTWLDEYTLRVAFTPLAPQPTKVQISHTYSRGALRALTGKQWPSWFTFPCTDIN